ncbi:pyridoxamine 5'-phosphate oxidase family protein [Dinoroseobacter sp. S76]|uniref:FAD-binding oxidoreductase n=1 Tax=Dinoroseobacter sp. S76 TaxID=3415124 RepID=UPI003C7C39CA
MLTDQSPFHAGERAAQARVGITGLAQRVAGFVRPFMPEQHRAFFAAQPFLVLAGADAEGQHWVTLLDGPEGFITSPDPTSLAIAARPDPQDPLAETLGRGADIGVLGIELATRRRNRMSGRMRQSATGFEIEVRQSYGNCPQYIHERRWHRTAPRPAPRARAAQALSPAQTARIRAADTLFLGTGQAGVAGAASDGFDASHRGGAPGFVEVLDPTHLRIPDYAGNNFFNTIGNLLENPAIGLVFVDFETGGLLHLTGRARIDWDARGSDDPGAQRLIDVEVTGVLDRPEALSLRWHKDDADLRSLVVLDKRPETAEITSLYLADPQGAPLPQFEAGQYLPVELDIPGHRGAALRSYSLSGAPGAGHYRLSIKREARGLASRHVHDSLRIGDRIKARRPAGDFTAPAGTDPLVLVSAGVGLTPMLSLLHAAALAQTDRPLWYVHGARDGAHHAMKDEVAGLSARLPGLRTRTFYSQPRGSDRLGTDYDQKGRVTAQALRDLRAGPAAHYMLCGPAAFVSEIRAGLEATGTSPAHIHAETFGPTA